MKYFILGMIAYACAIPVLESLVVLIQTLLEIPKGHLTMKVVELNKEMEKIQRDEEPVSTYAIGFRAPSNNEEYYEEEDDD